MTEEDLKCTIKLARTILQITKKTLRTNTSIKKQLILEKRKQRQIDTIEKLKLQIKDIRKKQRLALLKNNKKQSGGSPKTSQDKSPLNISNLPPDVIKKIYVSSRSLEPLQWVDKILLRRFGDADRMPFVDNLKAEIIDNSNTYNEYILETVLMQTKRTLDTDNDLSLFRFYIEHNMSWRQEIIEYIMKKRRLYDIVKKMIKIEGFTEDYDLNNFIAINANALGNNIVITMLKNKKLVDINKIALKWAKEGHLDLLKKMYELINDDGIYHPKYREKRITKEKVMSDFTWDLCNFAAFGGHIDIVEWAKQNDILIDEKEIYNYAAKSGNIDVFNYIVKEYGKPSPDKQTIIIAHAAFGNNLDFFKQLHEDGYPLNNTDICTAAAEIGNLKILQYAREKGCPWNENTCLEAARHGHLKVLKWAIHRGCAIHDNTCHFAREGRHLEVLKFAINNYKKFPDYINALELLTCNKQIDFLKNKLKVSPHLLKDEDYIYEIVKGSIFSQDIDILNWAYSLINGNTPTFSKLSKKHLFECAAQTGNINILQWLCNKYTLEGKIDKIYNEYSFSTAAKHGHIELLEWMKKENDDATRNNNPLPYTIDRGEVTREASKHGKLNVLIWLDNNNYISKENVLLFAGINSHLSILKWFSTQHKEDFEEYLQTNDDAIKLFKQLVLNNQIAVLKYVDNKIGYENVDYHECLINARINNLFDMLKYLKTMDISRRYS